MKESKEKFKFLRIESYDVLGPQTSENLVFRGIIPRNPNTRTVDFNAGLRFEP